MPSDRREKDTEQMRRELREADEFQRMAETELQTLRDQRQQAIDALRYLLDGVGAFTPEGWLAGTPEVVRARAVLLSLEKQP